MDLGHRTMRPVDPKAATQPLPFEEVYRRYADPVFRFCLSQLRDRSEAEDVAADVFVSAFAAYHEARPDPEGVLRWLLRIAKNAVVDRHRRYRFRSAVFARFFAAGVRDEPGTVDVEREVLMREEMRLLLDRIGRLRERDRLLIGLRVAAGLSYADIAVLTGMSERAAVVATGRAVERLRRLCEVTR
jgi:RNA polymerase sigma-70 factor (ECF subfamily)